MSNLVVVVEGRSGRTLYIMFPNTEATARRTSNPRRDNGRTPDPPVGCPSHA